MACFIVPMAEAIVVSAVKKKNNKLKWLSPMLWGGSSILALEHIYTGELWTTELSVMFYEMATRGVVMALIITLIWAIICKLQIKILQHKGILAALGIVLMTIIDISIP